jgi:hypothetical protein
LRLKQHLYHNNLLPLYINKKRELYISMNKLKYYF